MISLRLSSLGRNHYNIMAVIFHGAMEMSDDFPKRLIYVQVR